jgi:hypothetical protein
MLYGALIQQSPIYQLVSLLSPYASPLRCSQAFAH